MKKKLIAGILLAGTAALMLSAQNKPEQKNGAKTPPKMPQMPVAVVAVDKVVEMNDLEKRNYTGLIVSKSVVQITPRVSGEILKVGFADGSIVKKGQLLYQLDSVQYEAAVKGAEAKVAEAKARYDYAKKSFDRNSSLYNKKAASRDTMENTKSALETTRAAVMAAEAELISARDNLKNTRIIAPIDGFAGVTSFTQGNYLTPSSGTLVTIIQIQPVRVRFSISSADYLSMFGSFENLKKTASVRLQLSDGEDYATEGTIELLNNEANKLTDAIQVYATFPNQDFKLLVGSTVRVSMTKKQSKLVAAVPPSAVMHESRGSYVYVVGKDNKVEKRYIVPGNSTPSWQLIRSGLKKGETVIVQGTHKTMPGAVVETRPAGKKK
ncbi:MAG: efflux RND transporter periplasmic adaptor subunit [Lentisphaeria bacterium]|nr:efflux RND transporter periplasmic adaptor subunit [Lentisphaeria bacterium]